MVSPDYIARQLQGAWRLFLGDREGYEILDLSVDGFWNSFWALAVAAPILLFFLMVDLRVMAELGASERDLTYTANSGVYVISETAAYYSEWIGYLVLMIFFVRVLGLTGRYAIFVVAYNWASLVTLALALPPALLYAAGLLPLNWLFVLQLGILGIALWYRWFVAWTALGAGVLTAIGVVLVDLLFSLILSEIADRIHHVLV